MSLRLKFTEDFSEGLKRLMREEIEKALDYLRNSSDKDDKHTAVHEVRKAFKKIRACLRLVRDRIDYYKQENVWFRDWGREISDIRDATSNIEALSLLKTQYDSQLYENTFNKLQKN